MDQAIVPTGSTSLHARILADIRGRILAGTWPPGTRIPFEYELASDYGCSRMTVNKVLSQLARAGLVERRRKAGTFVARPRSQSAVLDIHEIGREIADQGRIHSFKLLRRRSRSATSKEIAQMTVPEGTPLLDIACCHEASSQPFCLEQRLINLAAVPEAADADFGTVPPGTWLMAQVPWTEAEHRIRAVAAGPEVAATLHVPVAASCLVVERRTWSAGQPITAVTLTYPGDAHHVVARFAPAG